LQQQKLALMEPFVRANRHYAQEDTSPELRHSIEGTAGGPKYRILHIDDDANDRALVAWELLQELPGATLIEAGDRPALENVLRTGGFDLVITDYELRWDNGLKLLQQLRAEFPNVPVIMFTGTGNEEVAVDAMKAGVCDYILKTPKHFERLRAAVRRAIEGAVREDKLQAAEARYKALFDTVPVGLFRSTPGGEILDANAAFLEMAGIHKSSNLPRLNFANLHPDKADFSSWRDKLERDGAVTCVESRFRGNDGKALWVEIHAKALRDPETREIYYEGSVEDISERKSVELEREKLIEELRQALSRVRSLAGLLPICSSCKKIRDAGGQWNILESYIERHSHAHFTHSFCPECAQRLYPEVFLRGPE
jgi:PAS domain S-box-containing protein